MRIFIISSPRQKTTIGLFEEACKARGVECVVLDPDEVAPMDIEVRPGDAVYRVSDVATCYGALELEHYLIGQGATSFYKNNDLFLLNLEDIDSVLLGNLGVTVPKTVNYMPKNREALKKCVHFLGGFPIIVKALGGSHGVGVMRVDSEQSLFSVSDYLRAGGGMYVMKEYCDVTSTARLIALGDKVIDSIEYSANKGDFRSNEGAKPNVAAKKFDRKVQALAVKAARALGLEFGGVDIMLTPEGPKVAEVNFPCFFARCQMLTGVDIAGQMVDFLTVKARRENGNVG